MTTPLIISRPLMGGLFTVTTWTQLTEHHTALINEGLDLIAELESRLTDFKDSPFNQINIQAGKSAVTVDAETFQLIQKAIAFSDETNGAFDISYASVGKLWREARLTGEMPSPELVKERSQFVNYKNIVLDEKNLNIFLPYEKMQIGLGGIGKGYAVDKLYSFLLNKGLVNFMVDGSGDIRVHSAAEAPRPWRLGIKNPFSPDENKKIGYIQLKNGALATSGDYINYIRRPELNKRYHHIIDPRTGNPTEGIVSSTILTETALNADLAATTMMILGMTASLEWLNKKKWAGFLVAQDGKVLMSETALQYMQGELK